jgi:tRNA1(Val) A37 N6-methylase TrmN6
LRLRQAPRGHRAGTDAVLLAASLPDGARRVVDLGAGSGVVGLRVAQMEPSALVALVERDGDVAALARTNIALNALDQRARVVEADVFGLSGATEFREAFDCVLTNPPFHEQGSVRVSPDTGKANAHVFGTGETLDGWLRNAAAILAPKGRLVMIHRADSTAEVLPAMAKRFGDIGLRFIHPTVEEPAIRVLASGIKGSRAPIRVLPPLVLNARGRFTPEAEALHQGTQRLSL